ncbi:hypothetical protein GJA_2093 [Janthinobacterium agaricidamnosum NBRC 102515 = DSM 9628]|uniref:Uncharacterized protein n=1 Tax=Janthinobacterium agaricidamnosum NBRC 102515 = DSM 9628 TaxID=1349767 RepID=W0V5U3_9BURK|nr:hypothetical protein GJA_2093 [Janthinobacterium agaricidamnosum NBRC 102515 = DSM 9628]
MGTLEFHDTILCNIRDVECLPGIQGVPWIRKRTSFSANSVRACPDQTERYATNPVLHRDDLQRMSLHALKIIFHGAAKSNQGRGRHKRTRQAISG